MCLHVVITVGYRLSTFFFTVLLPCSNRQSLMVNYIFSYSERRLKHNCMRMNICWYYMYTRGYLFNLSYKYYCT